MVKVKRDLLEKPPRPSNWVKGSINEPCRAVEKLSQPDIKRQS